MTVECAKKTTENGTTITLFLTSDKWGIRTWDLDTNGNITPASSPKSEGYFETDSDGNVQPYS